MDLQLEPQLLSWIAEEYEDQLSNNTKGAVSAKLLQVKLAMSVKDNGDFDLTKSMEHSLTLFGRSDLCRLLRQLNKQFLIEFVDTAGERLSFSPNDMELFRKQIDKGVLFVRPTALGLSKAHSILEQQSPHDQEVE